MGVMIPMPTILFLLLFFFSNNLGAVSGKSTIESCDVSDTCNAMVGYTLPTDLKIAEVASRFGVDPLVFMGANAVDVSNLNLASHILQSRYFVQIPIKCNCVNGIRKCSSVLYKVQAADTLSTIADSTFGGLVTAEQVRLANGVSKANMINIGQNLTIPLPCSCFNRSDNGLPVVYLSYVVKQTDTLEAIGVRYGTTVTDLMTVNALGTPFVKPGDVIAVPLAACSSSFSKYSSDADLLVANGSYTITASHCVQCSCGPADLNLYCAPAPLASSCSSMQCKNSNLMIGNTTAQLTSGGCNVTKCSYNGYLNGTILSSLNNALQPRCPGVNLTPNFTTLPSPSSSIAPTPGVTLSPKSSSSHATPSILGGFTPVNGPAGNISSAPDLLRWVSIPSFLAVGLLLVIHFGELQYLH